MRVFSGHRGALYLLGDELGEGERPRALLGVADTWRLQIDESIVDAGVLTPDPEHPRVATVTGEASVTLTGWDPRSALDIEPVDDVLVSLENPIGHLTALTKISPASLLAVKQRLDEPFTLNDLKEVTHVA